jgi:hyperosmotically inducible protein
MKSLKTALALGAALALLNSASAFAQTTASDAVIASAPVGTGKQVRRTNRAANHALALKVRAALRAAKPAIGMEDLYVIAKGGVITLVGYTNSAAQGARAIAIAKSVPGVTSVTDRTMLEEVRED